MKIYCKHCGKEIVDISGSYLHVEDNSYQHWFCCDPDKEWADTTRAELDLLRMRDNQLNKILDDEDIHN